MINNLYYEQEATIRINSSVLFPTLFNVCSAEVIKKALENETAGIKINSHPICNIRYADDTVLIAENIDDLQRLLGKLVEASEEFGISLNTKKTKFMIITKKHIHNINLYVKHERIERVQNYNYLGTNINESNEYTREIRVRIEKARSLLNNMK